MELDDEKEKVKGLENMMSEGEKALKKRVSILESNLEKITQMYHQLTSQKAAQTIDHHVNSSLFDSTLVGWKRINYPRGENSKVRKSVKRSFWSGKIIAFEALNLGE